MARSFGCLAMGRLDVKDMALWRMGWKVFGTVSYLRFAGAHFPILDIGHFLSYHITPRFFAMHCRPCLLRLRFFPRSMAGGSIWRTRDTPFPSTPVPRGQSAWMGSVGTERGGDHVMGARDIRFGWFVTREYIRRDGRTGSGSRLGKALGAFGWRRDLCNHQWQYYIASYICRFDNLNEHLLWSNVVVPHECRAESCDELQVVGDWTRRKSRRGSV